MKTDIILELYKNDRIDSHQKKPSNIRVSILLAVRNEENNILSCLKAIYGLNFPKESYEVLIGNDSSTDKTKEIVEKFIINKPNFRIYDVAQSFGNARYKASVVAQLAHLANGEYLFITDADVQVPTTWISGMLKKKSGRVEVASGCTMVDGERLFDKIQSLEWVQINSLCTEAARLKIPVTAVGNNMMYSKKAYFETGGYENLPFHINEDFFIFNEIRKRGYDFDNFFDVEVLAKTQPATDVKTWLSQHQRWLNGALELNVFFKSMVFIQALFLPFLIVFFFVSPFFASICWAVKFIGQTAFFIRSLRKINQMNLIWYIIAYELFNLTMYFGLVIYYFTTKKIVWKGKISP